MILNQIIDEASKEFDNTFNDWNEIIYEGDDPVDYYRMKEFINALVTKAYYDGKKEERDSIKNDVQSILSMLQGNADREKVCNYIRKYLLKT